MKRYWFSVITFCAGLVFFVFVTGGSGLALLDLPTFLFVGGIPLLFTSILYGFNTTVMSFSVFKKETGKENLMTALDFFTSLGKTIWITGFVAVVMGLMAILVNLEDRNALADSLVFTFLAILYSGILTIVIIVPYTIRIKEVRRNAG